MIPFGRPTFGIAITPRTITKVQLGLRWWPTAKPHIRSICEQQLPGRLIEPNDSQPNVSDLPAFTRELQTLIGKRSCLPVSVSLPTQCAQLGILYFDTLPDQVDERDSIIRWRFAQEFHLPGDEYELSYRVLKTPPWTIHLPPLSPGTVRVLVGGIRKSILAEYQRACTDAGLMVLNIGIQGLQLYDLCLPLMVGIEECYFASARDGHLLFIASQGGSPVFLRSIPLHMEGQDIWEELTRTIQYLDGQRQSSDLRSPNRSLFLDDDGGAERSPSGLPDAPAPDSEKMANLHQFSEANKMMVHVLTRSSLDISWPETPDSWVRGLPAVASVMAA